MAKLWGARESYIALERQRRFSEIMYTEIHKDNKKKENAPKLGIKSSVLKVYAEKGKLAAWQELQRYNEKISGGGFTLEMLEQWIGEYEKKQNRGVGKDNGSDR